MPDQAVAKMSSERGLSCAAAGVTKRELCTGVAVNKQSTAIATSPTRREKAVDRFMLVVYLQPPFKVRGVAERQAQSQAGLLSHGSPTFVCIPRHLMAGISSNLCCEGCCAAVRDSELYTGSRLSSTSTLQNCTRFLELPVWAH